MGEAIEGNYSEQAVAMCSDSGMWQNRLLGPGSGKRISENGPREVCFKASWALPYTLKGSSLPGSGLKDVERHRTILFVLNGLGISSGLSCLRLKEKAFPRTAADVNAMEPCQHLFRYWQGKSLLHRRAWEDHSCGLSREREVMGVFSSASLVEDFFFSP